MGTHQGDILKNAVSIAAMETRNGTSSEKSAIHSDDGDKKRNLLPKKALSIAAMDTRNGILSGKSAIHWGDGDITRCYFRIKRQPIRQLDSRNSRFRFIEGEENLIYTYELDIYGANARGNLKVTDRTKFKDVNVNALSLHFFIRYFVCRHRRCFLFSPLPICLDGKIPDHSHWHGIINLLLCELVWIGRLVTSGDTTFYRILTSL